MALPKGKGNKLTSNVNAELSEDKVIADVTETTEVEEVKTEEVTSSEEDKEEKETLPKVTFNADVEIKNAVEQNVKVKMKVDHSCSIGGVRYDLVKGKTYNVPSNVKRILDNADMLSPL